MACKNRHPSSSSREEGVMSNATIHLKRVLLFWSYQSILPSLPTHHTFTAVTPAHNPVFFTKLFGMYLVRQFGLLSQTNDTTTPLLPHPSFSSSPGPTCGPNYLQPRYNLFSQHLILFWDAVGAIQWDVKTRTDGNIAAVLMHRGLVDQ